MKVHILGAATVCRCGLCRNMCLVRVNGCATWLADGVWGCPRGTSRLRHQHETRQFRSLEAVSYIICGNEFGRGGFTARRCKKCVGGFAVRGSLLGAWNSGSVPIHVHCFLIVEPIALLLETRRTRHRGRTLNSPTPCSLQPAACKKRPHEAFASCRQARYQGRQAVRKAA